MVAQELALAASRARRPARARVHDARRAAAHPDAAQTCALMRRPRPTLAARGALRLFVENALAPPVARRGRSSSTRSSRTGWRTRPTRPAGTAQAGRGLGFDADDRLGEIAAPTLVLHGTADHVVDPRNAQLLAERDPGRARSSSSTGVGHCCFWERAGASSPRSSRSSCS